MPVTTDNKIADGDYQQQNMLIAELPAQPTTMDTDELQKRFDALGVYIIRRYNELVDALVSTFSDVAGQFGTLSASVIPNAALAEANTPAATTVAGQLAYLLWKINQVAITATTQTIGLGTIDDSKLFQTGNNILPNFIAHTTGTGVRHPIEQLPIGTSSTTVAKGDHAHTNVYAPFTHNHDAANISTGTVALNRLPTTTGTESTKVSLGSHTHDSRYYTESEVASLLASHTHAASAVNSGTLADARIPALAIGKISGLQNKLDYLFPMSAIKTGIESVVANTWTTVTFLTPFPADDYPIVICTVNENTLGNVATTAITRNGFSVRASVTCVVHWVAISRMYYFAQ